MSTFQIRLHEAIYSLSDALDLVGVTQIHHGKRVAYIAVECALAAGWQGDDVERLLQAAILHDCGVSKTLVHERLSQFEWEDDSEHTLHGAELLSSSPLLAPLAEIVRHHHRPWSELCQLPLDPAIQLAANCVYLADRIDILCLNRRGAKGNILLLRDGIRQTVQELRDERFESSLVDAFLLASSSEGFWFALENEHVNAYIAKWMSRSPPMAMEFHDLRGLVQLFSRIVDAKSSFTREHSEGVARLARYLGEQFGLPARTCEMLELAGLLHDLGKLRIPDALLEKPGRFTVEEYADVQRHSFDTYNILKRIHGLEEVALWAGQHHERVNGTGYPYRLRHEQLSQEARIVAVADVFQALAQNRPYRRALAPAEVLQILQDEVRAGKLDATIVAKVCERLEICARIALRPNESHAPDDVLAGVQTGL